MIAEQAEFDGIATETTQETNPSAQIEQRDTIAEIVRAHRVADETLVRVLDVLKVSLPLLKRFGIEIEQLAKHVQWERDNGQLIAIMRREVWRELTNRMDICRLMTVKASGELDKKLSPSNEPKLSDFPEVTEENIYGWLEALTHRAPEMILEQIKEAYEFLRPSRSSYVTNSEYEVGRRVIKEWWIDCSYGLVRVRYSRQAEITAVDNVFHMLDGCGLSKPPEDLLSTIEAAIHKKEWKAETKYFKVKWFGKGTMHLEFKRLDLLARFNEVAAGNCLKHDNSARKQEAGAGAR